MSRKGAYFDHLFKLIGCLGFHSGLFDECRWSWGLAHFVGSIRRWTEDMSESESTKKRKGTNTLPKRTRARNRLRKRARERERKRKREKEQERERERKTDDTRPNPITTGYLDFGAAASSSMGLHDAAGAAELILLKRSPDVLAAIFSSRSACVRQPYSL